MLAACSTTDGNGSGSNGDGGGGFVDILRIFKGGREVTDTAANVSRKIVKYKSDGQYDNAYVTIKTWTSTEDNFQRLFDDENVTVSSLQILAYKNDHDLFNKVLTKTGLVTERIDAYRNTARDFDALNRYFVCYFRRSPPDIRFCTNEVLRLKQLDPARGYLWELDAKADALENVGLEYKPK